MANVKDKARSALDQWRERHNTNGAGSGQNVVPTGFETRISGENNSALSDWKKRHASATATPSGAAGATSPVKGEGGTVQGASTLKVKEKMEKVRKLYEPQDPTVYFDDGYDFGDALNMATTFLTTPRSFDERGWRESLRNHGNEYYNAATQAQGEIDAKAGELSARKSKVDSLLDAYYSNPCEKTATQYVAAVAEYNALYSEIEPLIAAIDDYNAFYDLYGEELSTPRDASFVDVTINSLKRGYNQSRYGEEMHDKMSGSENEADKYAQILAGEDYQFEADGFGGAVSGMMEQLGQQARQWTNPRSLAMGGTAATAAFVAGQLGPQVLAPEEIVTVPGAFISGVNAGSTMQNYEIEAGLAYAEMLEQGISEETARAIATVVGGGNAALEALQLDELLKGMKVMGSNKATKNAFDFVLDALKKRVPGLANQVVQEVAQEGVTIAGTQVGSWLDKGKLAYSGSEVAGRIGDTALSSLLTFSLMDVPGATMNVSSQIKQNNAFGKIGTVYQSAGREVVDALVEEALTFPPESDAYKVAQEIKTKQDTGKAVSDADVGRLVAANENAIRHEENVNRVTDQETDLLMEAAREAVWAENTQGQHEITAELVSAGATEAEAESLAPILNSVLNGEEISGNQAGAIAKNEAAVSVLESATGETINTDAPLGEVKTAIRGLASRAVKPQATQPTVDTPTQMQPAETQETAPQMAPRARPRTIEEWTGYGEHGTKAFAGVVEQLHEDPVKVRQRFQPAYEAGLAGLSRSQINHLDPAQEAAYNAGLQDKAVLDEKDNNAGNAVVRKDAGFVYDTLPADVTPMQAKAVDMLGKATGVRVQIAKGLKGNAEISDDGTVLIDEDFERELNGKKRSIVFYAAHEIGMHRLMQLAPKEGRAFINALVAEKRKGLPYGSMTDAEVKHAAYAEQDVSLTIEKAMEEVSADEVLGLYENEDEFFAAIDRIMNGTNEQAKQGARTFKQWLDDTVRWLKQQVAKLTGKERAQAQETLNEVTSLRDLYERAMETAVNKVKLQGVQFSLREGKKEQTILAGNEGVPYGKGGKYDYATLITKPDMPLTVIDDTVQYPANKQSRRDIVDAAMKKAATIGEANGNGVAVRVNDVGADVILTGNSLKHGLDRRMQQNAAVTINAGEILRHSIRINELTPKSARASDSYVLLGAARGQRGIYIVEFVVNRFDNTVESMDMLYSVNAKKEAAVLNAPSPTGSPLTVTASNISIAQLLDLARDNFPDVLPESVLRHYGFNSRPSGSLGESALFSLKGEKDIRKEIERIRLEGEKAGKTEEEIESEVTNAVWPQYQEMIKTYGQIKRGENPAREVEVPKKTEKGHRVSQAIRTVLEAKATPDAAVPTIEELTAMGDFSYEGYTDKQAMADADNTIRDKGYNTALMEWAKSVQEGEVSKSNTALGWALYNQAANAGDLKTAMSILTNMVGHQRNAAQAVQATRILKKMSPEAQLYGVQRSAQNLAEELEKRYGKDAPDIQVNEELARKYLEAETDKEREEAMRNLYRDLGRQMPSRFIDKWNAWRYLAMLCSAPTHMRNIGGNAGFAPVVLIKDLTATAIEAAVSRVSGGKLERSKGAVGLGKQGRELLRAAWSDYESVADQVSSGGKYSDFDHANQYIQEGRRIFKSRALEAARKGNSAALEAEDVWFSRPHYAYALAQYCKAHGISPEMLRAANEGQKNTATRGGKITVDSTEQERYEILKNELLTVVDVDHSKLGVQEVEQFDTRMKSLVEKPLRELAKKLGITGLALENSYIDFPFWYSSKNIRKSIHHQLEYGGSYMDYAKTLSCIEELVHDAVLIETHPDYKVETEKAEDDLKQVYVMMSLMRDGDAVTPVMFEVKEFYNRENGLYMTVTLTKIDSAVMGTGLSSNAGSMPYLFTESKLSIAEILQKVNVADGEFLKYIPDEFLNSEQKKSKSTAVERRVAKYGERARPKRRIETTPYVDRVLLDRARAYAVKEAQKATYRDTNAFSQTISELGRYRGNNKVKQGVGVALEGILPFRKTPANILVRGLEYSPLGLANGIKQAVWDVKRGNKTAAEAIDSISAGLTGTGLLALGAFLAAQGLVRGSGGDDEEKNEFEEMQGHQAYALELPDGTSVTLDWLAPEVLPFFVGVNLWEQTASKDDGGVTMSDILTATANVTEPLLEMSCLQSLNDVFDAVGYASSDGLSALPSALASAATSYLTQGFPTILGQAERTGEDTRMTTYTEKNAFLTPDMQYTVGRISARLPGWDYQQIPYIDAWGRTESNGNAAERAGNNFLNPAYTSTVETSPMEDELLRLYEQTGDGSVLPSRAAKYFNVDGERKDLTAQEYVKYATAKGQTAYKVLTALSGSEAYREMSDAEKVEAVGLVYDYANATAKTKVSGYKPEGWIAKAVKTEKATGVKAEQYVTLYLAQKDIESLKEADGDTIANSKSLLVMEMVYNVKGLTDAQRRALFEDFGVGKTVIHWNKALVQEKLKAMRKKAA